MNAWGEDKRWGFLGSGNVDDSKENPFFVCDTTIASNAHGGSGVDEPKNPSMNHLRSDVD
jgi:hypothetical protein